MIPTGNLWTATGGCNDNCGGVGDEAIDGALDFVWIVCKEDSVAASILLARAASMLFLKNETQSNARVLSYLRTILRCDEGISSSVC